MKMKMSLFMIWLELWKKILINIGERNLLMSIAAILDPRCKMRVIDFCFPRMYPKEEAQDNIDKVWKALYEIYVEYMAEFQFNGSERSDDSLVGCFNYNVNIHPSSSVWLEFAQFVRTVETV